MMSKDMKQLDRNNLGVVIGLILCGNHMNTTKNLFWLVLPLLTHRHIETNILH